MTPKFGNVYSVSSQETSAILWSAYRRTDLPKTCAAPRKDQRIEAARERFGRPFAHESGTDWHPQDTPILTRWLSRRKAGL